MQMWEGAKNHSSSVSKKRRTWPPPTLKEPADVEKLAAQQWHDPKFRPVTSWFAR